jgi:predicted TIM-barrel fold metal-dependent hydrolase
MHRALGIERGGLVSPTVYGTENRCMLDALRHAQAGRWRGIAVIGDQTTERELDEMNELGVRGARCNFASFLNMAPDEELFCRTVERIARLGWHVVLHVMAEDLIAHESLFREVRIPVVVDHMAHLDLDNEAGGRAFDLLLELVGQDNWWIKLSNGDRISNAGLPYDDVVAVGRALAEAVPGRAIWGTDWPHVLYRKEWMVNDGDLVDLLARYVPNEAARNRILVDNPQELYGFSGAES